MSNYQYWLTYGDFTLDTLLEATGWKEFLVKYVYKGKRNKERERERERGREIERERERERERGDVHH